jgi:flagellar basal-body rod protein FlgF
MNYGLYLSATGVLANTYRQDVIANNLANSETVGFKRHLATFQERPTESQSEGRPDLSDPMLDGIGGGFLVSPTRVDTTQGEMETTGNNLDAAIFGQGYFAVEDHGKTQLTRAGQFMLNRDGDLIMANASGQRVLDVDGQPIQLPGLIAARLEIGADGQITHEGQPVARLGLFDVPDPSKLMKKGGSLFDYPDLAKSLKPADAQLRSGAVERSNVDPTTELTQLMETQRALEANANMIRYQDTAMAKLVNEVGKIG